MTTPPDYFDELFADCDDPWAFRERWYEKRKRDVILAALPHQHYERVFEAGSANGELGLALASRSTHFLGMDLCERAVSLARERLAPHPDARVARGAVPNEWPTGRFDLIVLSEVGYYMQPAEWLRVVQLAQHSLRPTGTLLACHWLQPIDGCPMGGAEVHRLLNEQLDLPRRVRHEESEFLLEVWTSDAAAMSLEERIR